MELELGIVGIVPVITLLVVALITKQMTSSFMIAIFLGCIIMAVSTGGNPFIIFLDSLYKMGMSLDVVWIFLMLTFIGVLIGILEQVGASACFIKILEKRVNSEKSLYFWTWMLSLVTFIDGSVRIVMLGQLAPLYDKHKVPRASLAYFADTTGSAFATLLPISSWALYYQGVMGGFPELETYGTPMEIYLKTLPFFFYSVISAVILILFTMKLMPKLGAMKTAYITAEETGVLYSERSNRLNQDEFVREYQEEGTAITRSDYIKIATFAIGVIILIGSMFVTGGDIILSSIYTIVVLLIVILCAKITTWKILMNGSYQGLANMLPILPMIFGAYMFKDTITSMGFITYTIEVAEAVMLPQLLPIVAFIICGTLAFFIGDSWGVPAICAAIAVPLCVSFGGNPFLVLGAIMSGGCFGAHCCMYADYTIFASQFTKIDNVEHTITQLPYGVVAGVLSAILFTVLGFVLV